MKTTLVATFALAAALSSAPALAQNAMSGYVGGGLTNAEVEFGGLDASNDGFFADTSFAADNGNGLGVQFDGSIAVFDETTMSDSESYSGTLHLFKRNDSFGFGGFVGASENSGTTLRAVGLEAVSFHDRVTLAGGLSYGEFDTDTAGESGGLGVNGEARFFVTDDLRLDLGAGLVRGDDDADVRVFSAGGELRIPNSAVSVFADYSMYDSEDDVSANVGRIGVRFTFGGTLRERDRRGPSFTGLKTLARPAF